MEGFLAVTCRGAFNPQLDGVPTFQNAEHNIKQCYLAGSLVELLSTFQQETILIWTAMMMKKRVVVFGDNIVQVLKTVRTLPMLVWWRQSWDQMWPFVCSSNALELEDLSKAGVFVAGFTTDPRNEMRDDSFDVFCDLNARRVIVSDHAKEAFVMGAFHKDVLQTMVQVASSEDVDDQTMVKELLAKSKKLVGDIQTLAQAHGGSVGMATLRDQQLPPHMDRFLYHVAVAEGLASK